MIRLSLIENLRRVAAFISSAGRDRAKAIGWAEQMIETTEKDPTSLILVVADMARSKPPRVSAFVTELTRRLQGQGPGLTLPLSWVDQWLSEVGMTREQMMHARDSATGSKPGLHRQYHKLDARSCGGRLV
jgi:cyclic beta-1,2-glucan synthetase